MNCKFDYGRSSFISEEDKINLNFLEDALLAQRIGLFGGILGKTATTSAIDEICNKYRQNKVDIPNIDELVINALTLGITADVIAIKIAVSKYNYLLEKYKKGEINYSLKPNIILIYANLLSALGDLLSLMATIQIASREGIVIPRPVR